MRVLSVCLRCHREGRPAIKQSVYHRGWDEKGEQRCECIDCRGIVYSLAFPLSPLLSALTGITNEGEELRA